MMSNTDNQKRTGSSGVFAQPCYLWFRVFDAATLKHICDVRAESADGVTPLHPYDPRINGDGEVIWQAA